MTHDGDVRVADLGLGFLPEAAVSGALLLQSEWSTVLTFNAMRPTAADRYEDAGTAVIEFERCLVTRFGLPNDEAMPGHPLFGRGLVPYGCFEVFNSPWRDEQEAQNSVAFPGTDYSSLRHFAFTFHDSSFECLARSLSTRLVEPGRFRSEYQAIVDRVFME